MSTSAASASTSCAVLLMSSSRLWGAGATGLATEGGASGEGEAARWRYILRFFEGRKRTAGSEEGISGDEVGDMMSGLDCC